MDCCPRCVFKRVIGVIVITKEQELMEFLHTNVFDNVLNSPRASKELKQGIRMTIVCRGATPKA